LPGLFLAGVVRLPASTGARVAVVVAVAAVTCAAGAAVVASNLCM
jgi:hypothetical protein